MPQSTINKVVDLWSTILETQEIELKIDCINKIKEIIIINNPVLLDNFYEDILGLLVEKNPEVRVATIDFIETACKSDEALLHKSLIRLRYIVDDDSFVVQKKLAATMITIYKLCLSKAVRSKGSIIDDVESFQISIFIVEELIKKIELPNAGSILMIVKLMESIIVLQSRRTSDSDIPKTRESDMSLDQIPENLHCSCLQIIKLENNGIRMFNILINLLNRDNCNSSLVHTLMTCLTNIGRQRPQFLIRVIQSFELTHVNMSDKLGEIQVNSIRKALKNNLMVLLKLPGCLEFQTAISTLLTDLGATQQEISRCLPKTEESSKKRKRKEDPSTSISKRLRTTVGGGGGSSDAAEPLYDDSVIRRFAPPQPVQKTITMKVTDNYVEQLSKELIPKLNIVINVTDLVLLSMILLPDTMPPAFQSAYTPIAAAGTQTQIAHLSRLLANQLISAGYNTLETKVKTEVMDTDQNDSMPVDNFVMPGTVATKISSSHQSYSNKKIFNLASVTKVLPMQILRLLYLQSFDRILTIPLLNNVLERSKSTSHTTSLVPYSTEMSNMPKWYFPRNKVLTSIRTSIFGSVELYEPLIKYCLNDIKNKFDILSSLVNQEFLWYKSFKVDRKDDHIHGIMNISDYNIVLVTVLNSLITSDVKETYFGRMLFEAPLLTHDALETLRSYCSVKINAEYGFQIVRELIEARPAQRQQLLTFILDFSSDDSIEIRTAALNAAKWVLLTNPQYSEEVLNFAKSNLRSLLLPRPSTDIYPLRKHHQLPSEWTEELGRSCLYLFLSLMPVDNSLIHLLAEVFVSTCQAIKRTILKIIDIPVKEMGMDSQEILNLVENCSNSQEIVLITRIVYILTDKTLPSPILVEKIKNLYKNKFPDVRLFVPILKGLTKAEITEVLPKLVTLSDKVVSEVFRRLLDVNAFDPIKGDFIVKTSPILPEELLLAVHLLEFEKVSLKCVIDASKMCFKEKQIFTQERLSIVIGKLLELSTIPTLFMRTLMQSFSMYPRMVSYVVDVLKRLIKKQIWKNASLWDGFIRCCVKLQQQSFAVLLQLPVDKLETVFNSVGEFRSQMRKYIDNCPQKQKLHISSSVLSLINSDNAGSILMVAKNECSMTGDSSGGGGGGVVATRTSVSPEKIDVDTLMTMSDVTSASNKDTTTTTNTSTTTTSISTGANVKAEKNTTGSSSITKIVLDKDKSEEDRKKRERTKLLLAQRAAKISFLPTK